MYLPFYYLVDDADTKEEWFKGSKSQIYLEMTSAWVSGFLPDNIEEQAHEGLKKVGEVSDIRKKVEELGVLGDPEKPKSEDAAAPAFPENKDGYTDEFRDKMNELFEDKIDNSSDGYNE